MLLQTPVPRTPRSYTNLFQTFLGHFGTNMFVGLFLFTFGTNIRPSWTNFDHFWDQKSEHVYVYAIWLYGYMAIRLYGYMAIWWVALIPKLRR